MRERKDANRTRVAGHLDEIQGSVANTLKLLPTGAVGFIDWLGASAVTMEDVMQQPEKAVDRVDLLHPRSKAKG